MPHNPPPVRSAPAQARDELVSRTVHFMVQSVSRSYLEGHRHCRDGQSQNLCVVVFGTSQRCTESHQRQVVARPRSWSILSASTFTLRVTRHSWTSKRTFMKTSPRRPTRPAWSASTLLAQMPRRCVKLEQILSAEALLSCPNHTILVIRIRQGGRFLRRLKWGHCRKERARLSMRLGRNPYLFGVTVYDIMHTRSRHPRRFGCSMS